MEDTIGVWFWDMGKKESSGDSYGRGKGLHAGSKGKSKGLLYVLTNRLTGERRVCHTQSECVELLRELVMS